MSTLTTRSEAIASRLIAANLAIRTAAAMVLVFGPWTNEASELEGWDIARFWAIATEPGRHWVDQAVEYPPGSVALIELLTTTDVVWSHRSLVLASLVVEFALVGGLVRYVGKAGAAAYLVLSLPLVPGGLVRFDLWATALAVLAFASLCPPADHDERAGRSPIAAAALVAGAAVKVMPILVIAVAIGRRRLGVVIATAIGGLAATGLWVAYGGADAISQVLSLRGATGWHVESLPGALTTLLTGDEARFEADVFRIGTIDQGLVWLGRGLLAGLAAALIGLRLRPSIESTRSIDAAIVVALIAGMLVTAPLLSPQFLLWLTPFVAIIAAEEGWTHPIVVVTTAATTLTGVTLAAYGPPGLDVASAAALLTLRNTLLVALIPLCVRHLMSSDGRPQMMADHER